ncbi:MAG: ribosome biogenesis GTPase Der [Proteobacteria bacterium]|nr:ribosome biogenesis GTPase Der [Pseudomonadota bacterium]
MKPIISIVGRPNVGKSTLFNRIVGYNKAITEDTPGVTRDRNYGEFEYDGRELVLVDTGGFEPATEDNMFQLVELQIHVSMDESSAILFVLDGKDGLLPQDTEIANVLRKHSKPVFYVINKVDSQKRENDLTEFYKLGAEKLYPVSAAHGLGIGELMDDVCRALPVGGRGSGVSYQGSGIRGQGKTSNEEDQKEDDVYHSEIRNPKSEILIAIAGRPNTGKSSIANRVLGSERMIVSEIPGTTRDSVDTKITFKGKDIILIDTAGLRRKSRISMKVEEYSVSSAIRTIERAHVVNLVIDAAEGVSHQDASIAHMVLSRGKGLCIVVNKWDLVKEKARQNEYEQMVMNRVPHCSFVPLVFTSAKTGKNIERIIETDIRIYGQLQKIIPTPSLNKAFEGFLKKTAIPRVQGNQIKIFYVNQVTASPPTFLLFSNRPELIPEHYKRYLENSLREKYAFSGAPIRLFFRKK